MCVCVVVSFFFNVWCQFGCRLLLKRKIRGARSASRNVRTGRERQRKINFNGVASLWYGVCETLLLRERADIWATFLVNFIFVVVVYCLTSRLDKKADLRIISFSKP